ncbi:protein jagged-2 isoform X2 [Esox lucius]|uniref:protein jagged-2 isoform X2 n=1 Tax=Esox lucius TaxID=8010 RepID=UPI00147780E1|nr:protein jagged-2 isoform X2 [Esox lucius]
MEKERAHGRFRVDCSSGGAGCSARTEIRTGRRTVIFLVALAVLPQPVLAGGMFELQIRHFQNPHGVLLNGNCCDLQATGGQGCSLRDQCDTFFKACLKEYQARVSPGGTCTFGVGSTTVLGGNTQSLRHRGHDGVGGGGDGSDDTTGHIVIPFKYAWPKSFSLVLEALDHDNQTEPGQAGLIERVLLSSMLNSGEQWQTYRHHGRTLSLEYRLRYRCDANYYGPFCNNFCRARDDFFGHFDCDQTGIKVCKDGWTGPECVQAVCRQGCHQTHGFCTVPGECKCHYGYQGALCDQCLTFPGCVYGSCVEPWQCVCDVNWGGLLCDKDLNYCGTHQPCQNGGTCSNTEPNEYQCECREGFLGRNCDIVEHACLSSPCGNGASCVEDPSGFNCVCANGWTGPTCLEAVRHCDSGPCGRGSTCQESVEGFQCLCPPGWTGRTCQLDTNECEIGVCIHARTCRNLIGGYLCDCLPGWVGPSCDVRNNSCQGLCLNGGRCEDSGSGLHCTCLPGFSGRDCRTSPSLCDSAPCQHGGQCVWKEGSAVLCSCPMGYAGRFCEVAVDLCDPNPCQQGVSCRSTEGGYMCACPDGYYGNECMSLKDPCQGQHCPGAMSGPAVGGVNLYMVLVGLSALVLACGCTACALLLSRLHRRRKKTPGGPQEEGINNQRESVTLIRNLERAGAAPPPPPLTPHTAVRMTAPAQHFCEEIELTLPPSPAPSHPSPALKSSNHAPKQDISNLEREKLNRFHHSDSQELEV